MEVSNEIALLKNRYEKLHYQFGLLVIILMDIVYFKDNKNKELLNEIFIDLHYFPNKSSVNNKDIKSLIKDFLNN